MIVILAASAFAITETSHTVMAKKKSEKSDTSEKMTNDGNIRPGNTLQRISGDPFSTLAFEQCSFNPGTHQLLCDFIPTFTNCNELDSNDNDDGSTTTIIECDNNDGFDKTFQCTTSPSDISILIFIDVGTCLLIDQDPTGGTSGAPGSGGGGGGSGGSGNGTGGGGGGGGSGGSVGNITAIGINGDVFGSSGNGSSTATADNTNILEVRSSSVTNNTNNNNNVINIENNFTGSNND